jgi:MYXO-CTERM domain-containing protein
MTRHRFLAVVIAASMPVCNPASADVEVYFDFNEWQNALTTTTSIGFTGFPDGTGITNQYEAQGVVFDSPPPFVLNGFDTFPNDGAGLHGSSFSGQIVANFLEPQYAIASHFTGDQQIELYSAGLPILTLDPFGGPPGTFVGFILDQPFDAAIIFDPVDPVVVIDDLHFGVQAPGILPLLGAVALFGSRRRRQSR